MSVVLWVLLGLVVGWLSASEYAFYARGGTRGVTIWSYDAAPAEIRALFSAGQNPGAWVVRIPAVLVEMDEWAWVKNLGKSLHRRVLANGDVVLLGH